MRLIQGLLAFFYLCSVLSISEPVVLAEEPQTDPITLVSGNDGPPLVGPPATVLAMGPLDYFVSDARFSDTESLLPQLWRTDGTTDATYPLPLPHEFQSIALMGVLGDRLLLLTRQDDLDNSTLWALDRWTGGFETLLVTPYLQRQFTFDERFYFSKSETQDLVELELWVTDGTPDGTQPVHFGAEQQATMHPNVMPLQYTERGLFLQSFDGEGHGLWLLDGAGFHHMRSFPQKADGISIEGMWEGSAHVGGTLYFFARTAEPGDALWRSDGTAAGTLPILPVQFAENWTSVPGAEGVFTRSLNALSSAILFFEQRNNTVYIHNYDTERQQHVAFSILPAPPDQRYDLIVPTYPDQWMGNQHYYFGISHIITKPAYQAQVQLWRSDGTPSGTHFLTRWLDSYPSQAVFAEQGMWTLSGGGNIYLSFVPYTNHLPVLHHNLGLHHVSFPQLQAGNAIYVTGRLELPVGPSFLFRIDPAWAAPPAQHLPVIASP